MFRQLFAFLSALCLLLCAATLVLWVRGRDRSDEVVYVTPGHTFIEFTSREGRAYLNIAEGWPDDCSGCYSGASATWYGPVFSASTGMGTDSELWGMRVHRGWFSVATIGGGTIIQRDGEPIEQCNARATSWPLAEGFELSVPSWILATALAIPAAAWLAMKLIRRRLFRRSGRCLICGYDLRASPERCPECGTAVSIESAAALSARAV